MCIDLLTIPAKANFFLLKIGHMEGVSTLLIIPGIYKTSLTAKCTTHLKHHILIHFITEIIKIYI